MDLALDTTGDLVYSGGELSTVTGEDELQQSLLIAMSTSRGEWLFDTDAGVAYVGTVRGRPADLARAGAEFRRVAAGVDGVTDVEEVDLDLDETTRTLTVTVTVSTIYGDVTVTV